MHKPLTTPIPPEGALMQRRDDTTKSTSTRGAASSSRPQAVEGKAKPATRRAGGELLPALVRNAPSAFEARGGSLERLRVDYRITRRQALEAVLMGTIWMARGERRNGFGKPMGRAGSGTPEAA